MYRTSHSARIKRLGTFILLGRLCLLQTNPGGGQSTKELEEGDAAEEWE